jgi:hypothetical protein
MQSSPKRGHTLSSSIVSLSEFGGPFYRGVYSVTFLPRFVTTMQISNIGDEASIGNMKSEEINIFLFFCVKQINIFLDYARLMGNLDEN